MKPKWQSPLRSSPYLPAGSSMGAFCFEWQPHLPGAGAQLGVRLLAMVPIQLPCSQLRKQGAPPPHWASCKAAKDGHQQAKGAPLQLEQELSRQASRL